MTKEMFTEAFEETMKNDVTTQGNKEEFTVTAEGAEQLCERMLDPRQPETAGLSFRRLTTMSCSL